MLLSVLNQRFKYKADPKRFFDMWFIIPKGEIMEGDCEDYALSVLYYDLCKSSLLSFWFKLIFGPAKICYVITHAGEGHAVLKYYDLYIDNWTKKWVKKYDMEKLGHKFQERHFLWFVVIKRMIFGYFRRKGLKDGY